jgi:hypothetical protein
MRWTWRVRSKCRVQVHQNVEARAISYPTLGYFVAMQRHRRGMGAYVEAAFQRFLGVVVGHQSAWM